MAPRTRTPLPSRGPRKPLPSRGPRKPLPSRELIDNRTAAPLVVVPARQWSEGTPGKNRAHFASVVQTLDELDATWPTLVATDDPWIVDDCHDLRLPVLIRPDNHDGPMIDLLAWVLERLPKPPDTLILLQPSSPTHQRSAYVAAAWLRYTTAPYPSSVVSVVPWQGYTPSHACHLRADGILDVPPATRRQEAPRAYRRDGTVYVFRAEHIRDGTLYGPRPAPLLVAPADSVTID